MHDDQLKTKISLLKPLPKKGYVILPGHFFYKKKVTILQFGSTSTQI